MSGRYGRKVVKTIAAARPRVSNSEHVNKALRDAPPITRQQMERIARLLTPTSTRGDE